MSIKIKTIVLSMALFFVGITTAIMGSPTRYDAMGQFATGEGEIELFGSLMIGPENRNGFSSINARYSNGNLSVQFNADLGSITIEVTDANGVEYYKQTVSSTLPRVLNISTAGWPAGTYTITLYNNNGTAEGNFEI